MKKKIPLLRILFCAALAASFSLACGGSGGSGSSSASSGSVVLYATDSPEDDYTQVIMTLNSVQLLHTGSGNPCILTDKSEEPAVLDITELSSKLQLLEVSTCNAESYNRIHIEFDRTVTLSDGTAKADCQFTSYKNNNNKPNVLHCDDITETCTMDINGAVNVLTAAQTVVALDFELKEFEVEDFPAEGCSVTMKVSPLNAS
ncbi:MAG: DUF4382 domain-containing protein, partial [Nitrospiraceae bacterium]